MELNSLDTFDYESSNINVVIETPRGSRNKYKFVEKNGVFMFGGILPIGAVFPFDFGFIPKTLGGDGDPLDVLILIEEPAFAGCLVPARLIGVIEAEQTEEDKTDRNDRLIAVPINSKTQQDIKSIKDLSETLVDQIEHFFISYNLAKGKKFEPIGRFGSRKALSLVEEGIKNYKLSNKKL